MITLPNGCSCSNLSVFPKNWQSKSAKVTMDWYFTYRFYDPRYPKPKQVMVKGMNHIKNLIARQEATKNLMAEELDRLVKEAFNPFNKLTKESLNAGFLTTKTPFVEALRLANEKVSVSDVTKRDLTYLITLIDRAVIASNMHGLSINEVSRRTIKLILDGISKTPDRYNKYRSYLMILFSELCESEAITNNPVRDIKKKKVTKHLRSVLDDTERQKVNDYLQTNYPTFHRFLHIFFHSGARISELIRVTESDVDLPNQRYKLIVRKGRNYKEVWKTIKDIALPYWENLLLQCGKGDYLFSRDLKPGKDQIMPYQITKRWYRLVKQKLGIKADFYSLKHLHTTEIVELLDDQAAAKHNEHTSTAMVVGIYDVKRANREHNKVKSLNNRFV